MAGSLEWVKWEPKRWLTSEARMRMTPTERSIYRDLLDCQYVQGSLPSDERTLAGLAGVTEDEFKIAWPNVKKEFEVDPKNEGRIIQKHAATVRAEAIKRLKSLRSNGLKGGRPRNQKVNQMETKRLTKSLTKQKPNGPLRASTLLLSSSVDSKCSTEEENSYASATPEDFAVAILALERQHPEGHNPRPQLTSQMVISRCGTVSDCAAIVREHAAWIPAWNSGRTVDDLHNWIAKWERGAQPPAPQADKRSRTADTIAEMFPLPTEGR